MFSDRRMNFFYTAGPNQPDIHYKVEPILRWNLEEMTSLLYAGKHFILYAPRQTGKRRYMLSLMDYLNKKGDYKSLYVNIDAAQDC